MFVTRATKADLNAVQALLDMYPEAHMAVGPEHLTTRDIALQVRLADGTLVAFCWVGLMAASTLGYVDKVVIHPAYKKQGLSTVIYSELVRLAHKRGVKTLIGAIKHGPYHDASGINAVKMGMGAVEGVYTLACGHIPQMVKILNGEC